jgi:CBS domain-containing protein
MLIATSGAAQPTAAEFMTASPRSCSNFSTVLEAVMIFRDADCGAVPIVEDGKPTGILTDRDVALALAMYPDVVDRPVTDVMTKGVISVLPEATLDQVIEKFNEEGVRRLLVVDSQHLLLGIISWSDLAERLARATLAKDPERRDAQAH